MPEVRRKSKPAPTPPVALLSHGSLRKSRSLCTHRIARSSCQEEGSGNSRGATGPKRSQSSHGIGHEAVPSTGAKAAHFVFDINLDDEDPNKSSNCAAGKDRHYQIYKYHEREEGHRVREPKRSIGPHTSTRLCSHLELDVGRKTKTSPGEPMGDCERELKGLGLEDHSLTPAAHQDFESLSCRAQEIRSVLPNVEPRASSARGENDTHRCLGTNEASDAQAARLQRVGRTGAQRKSRETDSGFDRQGREQVDIDTTEADIDVDNEPRGVNETAMTDTKIYCN